MDSGLRRNDIVGGLSKRFLPTYPSYPPPQIRPHTPSIFRDTGGAAATSVRKPAGGGGRAPLRVERTRQSGGRYGKRWGLRSRRPTKSRHPEAASVSFFIPYEANAVSGSVRLFDNRSTGGALSCAKFRAPRRNRRMPFVVTAKGG